ncbi:MAG: spore coat associated protein CotJA [Brotaphodocola sp.]
MENLHLAIASIPVQHWEIPYDSTTALCQGTIFPSLDLPFFITDSGPKGTIPTTKGGGKHD